MVAEHEWRPVADDEAVDGRRGFLAWVGRVGTVVAGGVAGLVSGAALTAAHPVGSGGWADNHTICATCTYRSGNIVRLWQQLLWSARIAGTADSCGAWVDGIFGPATATATRNYQRTRQLSVDGIVGSQTWTKMRQELHFYSQSDTYWNYAYPAPDHNQGRRLTNLRQRKSTGVWTFQRCGSASWTGTGH